MWLVDLLLGALALVALVPALTLLVQVLMSFRRLPDRAPDGQRLPIAVLIPAHNESAGIVGTLRSVLAQVSPGDRVLVVADNCSDDTAERARAAGATVVERSHATLRGKGYALDHGIRWLEAQPNPPHAVVFVDADCTLGPGTVDRLAREAVQRGVPVQALDLMHAQPGSSLNLRVAEFAWLVKNQVRPLGMRALGLPCQLMGTGMAIPWALVREAPLASGALAEDMELGLGFARAGQPPVYCPQAAVHSFFPTQAAGAQAQRRRWEHGHLAMIRERGLPLLMQGLRRGHGALTAMALDACVPPLASLVAFQGAWVVVTGAWRLVGGSVWPLALAMGGFVAVTVAVLGAWRGHGRAVISGRDLLGVPAYVLGKLSIYRDALLGRRAGWQRARRDHDS